MWHKFEAENDGEEISYSQFCCYVPENIKPKPEDWGTCLCLICMNPEFKLSCIKKTLSNVTLTIEDIIEDTPECHRKLEELYTKIESCQKEFKYLEWAKETWIYQRIFMPNFKLNFNLILKIWKDS